MLFRSWLNKNGYQIPDKSVPIVNAHVEKGDVFLALKLLNGKGIEAIRPIRLKVKNADPCVPLRLTSIAASEDMSVVVTVAGPGRAVPKNGLHVVVNPLRLNWFAGASNYPQVLAAAIDEAGGHAFSAEAAGDPKILLDANFVPAKLDGVIFKGLGNVADLAKALTSAGVPVIPELVQVLPKASPELVKAFPGVAPEVLWQQLGACGGLWTSSPNASCPIGGSPCGGPPMGPGSGTALCGGQPLTQAMASTLPVDATLVATSEPST